MHVCILHVVLSFKKEGMTSLIYWSSPPHLSGTGLKITVSVPEKMHATANTEKQQWHAGLSGMP